MNKLNKELMCHANKLTEARYSLSVTEQKLILYCIAKIDPNDMALKPYKIALVDFPELLNIQFKGLYTGIKRLLKGLSSRVLEIKRENGGYLITNWISSAEYLPDIKVIELCFDPKLRPYLLELKKQFTVYKLSFIVQFQSAYTIRLYQLLKQYQNIGHRTFELEALRLLLGIDTKLYPEFKEFKRRVLNQAKKEFEVDAASKSDITFECEYVREARRIVQIKFIIISQKPKALNKTNSQPLIISKIVKLLEQIPEAHRNKKTVQRGLERFLKSHGNEYVLRNIGYTNQQSTTSYAGYLNHCLKEDWGVDWTSDTQKAKKAEQTIRGISMTEIEQKSRPGETYEQVARRLSS